MRVQARWALGLGGLVLALPAWAAASPVDGDQPVASASSYPPAPAVTGYQPALSPVATSQRPWRIATNQPPWQIATSHRLGRIATSQRPPLTTRCLPLTGIKGCSAGATVLTASGLTPSFVTAWTFRLRRPSCRERQCKDRS